jgi:hypothetical protein
MGQTATRSVAVGAVAMLLACPAWAEDCPVMRPDSLLPKNRATQPAPNALPSPSTNNDCAFYNEAWNSFLFITQKGQDGRPAFLSYPTVEAAFPRVYGKPAGHSTKIVLYPRNVEPVLNTSSRQRRPAAILDDGITQAAQGGIGAILVDRNRNPVYYTINVNNTFRDFVAANGLDDIKRLLLDPSKREDLDKGAVPAELEFRPGSLELKSSWMVIEGNPADFQTYITAEALVPVFKNVGTQIAIDEQKPSRSVKVALLGLHVVGVVDGHPEFIWASFEHADAGGHRDIAPAAIANPDNSGPQAIAEPSRIYPLYGKGSTISEANSQASQPIGADQKFSKSTPVYRMFPGSQASMPSDKLPAAPWEDPAVFTLNQHIGELFDLRDPKKLDLRRYYRLLGAVWIDQPRALAPAADASGSTPLVGADGIEVTIGRDGKLSGPIHDTVVRNFDAGVSFADDDSRLAGENRLSNMSMESFTQPSGTGAPNCFSCHDTSSQDAGVQGKVLWPRRINVSHILTLVTKHFLDTSK